MRHCNILYLIRTWALGGSHTIVLLLLKHLPRDRFNIICVPYDTPSHGDDAFIAAMRKQGLEPPPERIPWHGRSNWFHARDAIAGLIRKYEIGLLHAHDPQSTVLTGLGRKRWPCACVVSEYGFWRRWLPLRSHVYTFIENQFALPKFERVITVSDDMRAKILGGRTAEERLRVVRTGLDYEALKPAASREEVRRGLGIPLDALVVGTVSRLYVEKGHAYLLNAAALLKDQHPNLRLLIVGSGPLLPALQSLANQLRISDRVIFTGFYDDLPGALGAMDVFAQPSILDEGFPTSVLEAQACGLPIVASDIGGTRETMAPGHTGLLVRPKDGYALANALSELLADAGRRTAMGAAARTRVRQTFTLESMIDQMSAIYDEALALYLLADKDAGGPRRGSP